MTSLLCLEGDAEWSHSHITGFHFGSCKRAFARDGSPGLPVPISLGRIANPDAQGEHNTCVHAPPPHPHPPLPLPMHFQGENMQSATIVQTKTAEENRANEGIKMHPWRHVFLYLSLWPSSSRPPLHRSCLSLHFSSNCISWPDAGPSDDNMDAHLPLFRIRELKTLNVEILSSYSNSLAP